MSYYLKDLSSSDFRKVERSVFFGLKKILLPCEEVEFNDVAPRFKVLYLPGSYFKCVEKFLNQIWLLDNF